MAAEEAWTGPPSGARAADATARRSAPRERRTDGPRPTAGGLAARRFRGRAEARDRARFTGAPGALTPGATPIASPRPGAAARTRFPAKPDTPRSSEPTLLPKVRIRVADFPYLHYSID